MFPEVLFGQNYWNLLQRHFDEKLRICGLHTWNSRCMVRISALLTQHEVEDWHNLDFCIKIRQKHGKISLRENDFHVKIFESRLIHSVWNWEGLVDSKKYVDGIIDKYLSEELRESYF